MSNKNIAADKCDSIYKKTLTSVSACTALKLTDYAFSHEKLNSQEEGHGTNNSSRYGGIK